MTKNELAKSIENAVTWLKEHDAEGGCFTFRLDDRLAVCVGWTDGYDEEDTYYIHSVYEPTYVICVGIKVWTSDDMGTDFDWINSPYYEHGEVLDTDCGIAVNANYNRLATWLLKEYNSMKHLEITENGLIIEEE